jgi:hypothetical protein
MKDCKVEMNKCNGFGRDFNWFSLNLNFSLLSYEYWEKGIYFQLGDVKILTKVSKKLTKLVYFTFYTRKAHLSKMFPNLFIEKWQNMLKTNPLLGMIYLSFIYFPLQACSGLPYSIEEKRARMTWNLVTMGSPYTPNATTNPHMLTLSNL